MGTDKPFVLAQLSDPHVGASWIAADPLARLHACVAALRTDTLAPDAVVIPGDLAEHGSPDEYALVRDELAALTVPVYAVPGNHDDRRALRACFDLPGHGDAPISYAVEIGPLRLLMLDSTIPGDDGGDLGPDQLGWLKARLHEAPERPTVLVMHHPPLRTGVTAYDGIGLSDSSRLELASLLGDSDHVLAVLSGHLHRPIAGTVGGRLALTGPSTYVQSRLDLTATELQLAEEEPPAFAIHALLDDCLTSHLQFASSP